MEKFPVVQTRTDARTILLSLPTNPTQGLRSWFHASPHRERPSSAPSSPCAETGAEKKMQNFHRSNIGVPGL